ncbi:hypothetical protein SETIT_9G304400v2 [Setaria italica]|uniref:Uncharacterized protein n=1 Tax=Setaria italica TaxID=4555 RepID=A0A368SM97_SETIT|nr:hypothetical protein SETIT_9G304400v2 [Setaria italica]
MRSSVGLGAAARSKGTRVPRGGAGREDPRHSLGLITSRKRPMGPSTGPRHASSWVKQGPLGGTPTRCVGKGPRISPHGSPGAWITSGEGNGWECINGTPASTGTIGEAAHHNYTVPIKTSSLRGRHGGAACD